MPKDEPGLGPHVLPLQSLGLGVGGALAVIGFLVTAMGLSHDFLPIRNEVRLIWTESLSLTKWGESRQLRIGRRFNPQQQRRRGSAILGLNAIFKFIA